MQVVTGYVRQVRICKKVLQVLLRLYGCYMAMGQTGHAWDEVFALESQISDWKIRHPDFVEGVRARLVDKDLSPEWKAAEKITLQDILSHCPQ